jgi:hypothetical protein
MTEECWSFGQERSGRNGAHDGEGTSISEGRAALPPGHPCRTGHDTAPPRDLPLPGATGRGCQKETTSGHQETWQLRLHFVRWRSTIPGSMGERNG